MTESAYQTLLFEAALRAAATARGLPASCRRRACRDSGTCALRHQPWNGAIDRGCNPDFAIARAAAEHVGFLHLLARIDPEGTVYDGVAAPYLKDDPKGRPKPAPDPEVWAMTIAAAFAIPVLPAGLPPAKGRKPKRASRLMSRPRGGQRAK